MANDPAPWAHDRMRAPVAAARPPAPALSHYLRNFPEGASARPGTPRPATQARRARVIGAIPK
jgi:hypothetical protein